MLILIGLRVFNSDKLTITELLGPFPTKASWRQALTEFFPSITSTIGILLLVFWLLSYVTPDFILSKINTYETETIGEKLAAVLLAPFIEEILFEGLALKALSKRYSLKTAIWSTSIIFGILHF